MCQGAGGRKVDTEVRSSLPVSPLQRLARAHSVDVELRAILTPEQRLRLDSLRRDQRLMLKRKIETPAGTRVDTLIDTNERSGSR